MEDPLPDSFTPGASCEVTHPKAPSCQVTSLHPGTPRLVSPCLSLTCNWCLQVVAETLAKAEELNGPELAAKFRSQPREPLAARLQVISHIWILPIIMKLLSM